MKELMSAGTERTDGSYGDRICVLHSIKQLCSLGSDLSWSVWDKVSQLLF